MAGFGNDPTSGTDPLGLASCCECCAEGIRVIPHERVFNDDYYNMPFGLKLDMQYRTATGGQSSKCSMSWEEKISDVMPSGKTGMWGEDIGKWFNVKAFEDRFAGHGYPFLCSYFARRATVTIRDSPGLFAIPRGWMKRQPVPTTQATREFRVTLESSPGSKCSRQRVVYYGLLKLRYDGATQAPDLSYETFTHSVAWF